MSDRLLANKRIRKNFEVKIRVQRARGVIGVITFASSVQVSGVSNLLIEELRI
jgi:hypothetical protein